MERKTKSYATNDFYKSYKEHTAGNPAFNVPLSVFRGITKDFFKHIADSVIDKSREVRIPARLGSIFVMKKKPYNYNDKNLRVDYYASKQEGKILMHLNEHSDGYNYKFRWSLRNVIMSNATLYEMIPTRENKRRLARAIIEDKRDYIEVK